MARWDEVDVRVLRWAFAESPSLPRWYYQFETDPPEEIPELDGLPGDEFDRSLTRLHGYGLIDGQRAQMMMGTTRWSNVRITALGLIALGEWPDLDRLTS